MAGGTPEHAALAAALIGLSFPQLRGRCRAYKFDHYKTLPSLQQYVLVSHHDRSGDIVRLASIGASLDVNELYDAAAEPAAES